MLMMINPSLYDSSQQEFNHRHPHTHIYIYICHTSHQLWENLQAYNVEGTVQQEKEHKTKEHTKLLELCSNLMTFPSSLPKTTPHTIHRIFSAMHLTSSIRIGVNMISLFQKV